MFANNLKISFSLRFLFPNSIWLVVLSVVEKIYINASLLSIRSRKFNRDQKLVDVNGLRSSLIPLSKFLLIRSETLVKSWKPFYLLKESIPYPGLVLVAIIYYELLQFFSKLSQLKLKQLHIYL